MDEPIQYSLGQPRQRTGLGGYSLKTTIILAIGFAVFLLINMAGHVAASFASIPVTLLVAALFVVEIGGRSLAESALMAWVDTERTSAGEHIYISGPQSKIPGGHRRLPGLLARTELEESVDIYDRPFGIILDKPRREATIVLSCDLTGQTAMTQDDRNLMTAEWARWLNQFSLSGDVISIATVVCTRPGSGELVAREVESLLDDSAPEIAKRIMLEAATTISFGRPEIESHIAITVKVDGTALQKGLIGDQLAPRVAAWADGLQWAGIMSTPMSKEQIIARAHAFFNPAAESDFEAVFLKDGEHSLAWEDAGPAYAVCHKNSYDHDGCRSLSWEMKEAPRSTFEDSILSGLLSPHDRVTRKRVCLVYRPYEAGKGAAQVEAEHQDALVAANSTRKITSAKAELRLEHTEAARQAQARGAQLGRYSLFVTATTTDETQVDRISHDVQQLAAGASIRLQPMRRQQDLGFITTMGLGCTPWSVEEKKWAKL